MTRIQAVFLDAMGTLLRLEPPAPLLREELRTRFGLELTQDEASAAVRAEIACYRASHLLGADAEGLAELRGACTEALRAALPDDAGRELPAAGLQEALLAALRFTLFPDAVPALTCMRESGLKLVVVSNWDVALHGHLEATGLSRLLDGAVTSAEVGVAKPDPEPFRRALALAGVPAGRTIHVGDAARDDVEGARAAGIRPVLLLRDGIPGAGGGVDTVISLAAVPALAGVS